jgi:type VI secretion system secreted protein VgrG
VFDFQGDYVQATDGKQLAEDRLDELQSRFHTLRGRTNAQGLEVGRLFSLTHHPRDDQNAEYLVTGASVSAQTNPYESSDATVRFECNFTAIPSEQQFRPARRTPKPFVQGPQTAVVVGPAGEEIHTDNHGRVKVQFHWDRYHQKNEDSSCWMRVSHPWAGKGWGSVSIPRIGQEVIVDFLEGDPDQPIVTGRVYNGENMAPFALPAAAATSGMKSKTHRGSGYNEISADDTAGKEKVNIHAQYDMTTTVQHDQTNTVNNKFTETIKSDAKVTVTEGTYSHDVAANTAKYHVSGDLTENYDAKQTTTVKGDLTIVSAAGAISISADAKHIYIHAATSIQLHTGASKLWMASDGNISLEGVNITVQGSSGVFIKGGVVHSEAETENQTKGAVVLSHGEATNTVKGGMVMLNPD